MIRYLQRSLKYFIGLCTIYIAVVYLTSFFVTSVITPEQPFRAIMSTQRGMFLVVAIFFLSAVYPLFGYMRRYTKGDLVANRAQIMESAHRQGMVLDHESQGRMTFVAGNFLRRVTMLFEDHVKVVQEEPGKISIAGNRKIVAYLLYRLEYAIELAEQQEKGGA